MSLKKTISLFFDDLTKDIVNRANQKDQNVSNKIPKSFNQNIDVNGDTISATLSAWKWTIAAWETGRGKRKSTKKTDFEEKLQRWIDRKGLKMSAKSLRWWINKHGTRLHQGKDKRFSGNRSMTISDFINQKSVSNFAKSLAASIVKTEITPLLNFRK